MATTQQEMPSEPHFAPSLKGLTGRLSVCVKGELKVVLEMQDGTVRLKESESGAPDATLHCNHVGDLASVLRGEMNAVVAALRGCMYVTGNREFGARVMLGLNAGSPYKGERLEALD